MFKTSEKNWELYSGRLERARRNSILPPASWLGLLGNHPDLSLHSPVPLRTWERLARNLLMVQDYSQPCW